MADALGLASLRAELAARGVPGEVTGKDLCLDTGPAGRLDVTTTVHIVDAAGGGVVVATVASEAFVPDRQQDPVRSLLRPKGVDFELRRELSRRSGVVLHRRLGGSGPPPTPPLAAVWVLRFVDAARSTIRELERELYFADPLLRPISEAGPLLVAGKHDDAVRVLRRGLADLPRHAPERMRGWYLALLGHVLDGAGHEDEARPLLDEGLSVLAPLGDGWVAARVLGDQVQLLINRSRPREALALCDRVDELLAGTATTDDRAWADLRRAQALINHEREAEARTLLLDLERRLMASGHETIALANARFGLGLALQKSDDLEGAIEFYVSAERIYRSHGDVLGAFRSSLNRAAALIEAERHADALDVIRHLRATRSVWVQLANRSEQAQLDTMEAAALHRRGRHDEAGQLFARAAATAEPGSATAAVARHNLGKHAHVQGDDIAALEHMEAALRDYERLGLATPLAAVQRDRAGVRMRQIEQAEIQAGNTRPMTENLEWGDVETIHADALAALRAIERRPAHLDSVADRERWAMRLSSHLGAAVMSSCLTERHRTALELLERARAQGLPDVPASAVAAARAAPLPADDEIDPSVAGDDEPTAEELGLAGVRAAMHDLAVTPPPSGDVAAETRLVGGPHAWRWTLWKMGGTLLWAVLRADGEVVSGVTALEVLAADHVQLHPSTTALFADKAGPDLDRLRRATGQGLAQHEWATVLGDLLVADDADAEPEVAWEVGRRLIPPPLLTELQRRLDHPDLGPLPLVVAPSPGLAHLPYGLLAVTPPGDAPPLGRRLVEAAVVTLAPPSALAADLRARPPAALPFDVRLSVIDPVGDLPGAAGLADPADLADGERPATRAEVFAALRAIPAGDPGVLVWAGRAVAPDDGNPLGTGLRLRGRRADGTDERLTTGDVVFERLPAPRRVVLLGCSTLGAARDHDPDRPEHLADAEEWWGFPVVLLHAGASAVLATTWKTIDCPATAAIAAELVAAARVAPDLAAALREVQLRCLGEWARQREVDRAFTSTATDRHPHLWAAWAVTGVQRG